MTLAQPQSTGSHPVESARLTMAALREVFKSVNGVLVLDGVSFSVHEGDTLLVSGPSGSGKSTALRMLKGIETPDSGSVYLLDRPIAALSKNQRRQTLQAVGIGFQDPLLDNALSVLENLVGLARVNGRFNEHEPTDLARAARLVDVLEISHLLHRPAAVLSGGQKLRVAIGRALICRPRLLLLDEPTHMVDSVGKVGIYAALRESIRQERLTAVIVSHDPEAAEIATSEVVIDQGKTQ